MRGHQHDWSRLQISTDLADRKIPFCVSLHGVTPAVRRLFRCGEWIRIILRSSGQQGHRHAPASRQAPLGADQTDEGGDLFTAHASELAIGPQKISSKT